MIRHLRGTHRPGRDRPAIRLHTPPRAKKNGTHCVPSAAAGRAGEGTWARRRLLAASRYRDIMFMLTLCITHSVPTITIAPVSTV